MVSLPWFSTGAIVVAAPRGAKRAYRDGHASDHASDDLGGLGARELVSSSA